MRNDRARLTFRVALAFAALAAVVAAPASVRGAGGAADFALARFLKPTTPPLVTYRASRTSAA